jgi:hypothetical protein
VPPDTPLVVTTPDGSRVQVSNATSPAYSSAGNGTTSNEQFLAYHYPTATDPSLIQAGQDIVLQSMQTGLWCRLARLAGLLCDQANRTGASALMYTGAGLSLQGTPLVSSGSGLPLLLNGNLSRAHTTLALQTAPPPAGGGWAQHIELIRQCHLARSHRALLRLSMPTLLHLAWLQAPSCPTCLTI